MMRTIWGPALGCVLSLAAQGARAQSGGSEAERLFREGVEAANAGDYATSCEKLHKSLDLVERPSTLLNLAICETELGKLGSALERYKAGIALLPAGDARLQTAAAQMEALAKRVPRLTIALASSTPSDAKIMLDGREVGRGALEKIAVDPGEHALVLVVPGHRDAKKRVVLKESAREKVTLEPGAPIATGDAPAPPPDKPKPEPDTEPEAGVSPVTIAGAVIGGVGVAAIGVGIGLGVVTLGTVSDAEDDPNLCPGKVCSEAGRDEIDSATVLGHVSTAMFAVGGAAVVTGIVLIVVGATGSNEAAIAPYGFGVRGRF